MRITIVWLLVLSQIGCATFISGSSTPHSSKCISHEIIRIASDGTPESEKYLDILASSARLYGCKVEVVKGFDKTNKTMIVKVHSYPNKILVGIGGAITAVTLGLVPFRAVDEVDITDSLSGKKINYKRSYWGGLYFLLFREDVAEAALREGELLSELYLSK